MGVIDSQAKERRKRRRRGIFVINKLMVRRRRRRMRKDKEKDGESFLFLDLALTETSVLTINASQKIPPLDVCTVRTIPLFFSLTLFSVLYSRFSKNRNFRQTFRFSDSFIFPELCSSD
jgi:hypothetical protein